jgi:hypothetical protein
MTKGMDCHCKEVVFFGLLSIIIISSELLDVAICTATWKQLSSQKATVWRWIIDMSST